MGSEEKEMETGVSQAKKPLLRGDQTRIVEDAIRLADDYKLSDPCGALLIRKLASLLRNDRCARCSLEYSRGYSVGYKAGVKEWEK